MKRLPVFIFPIIVLIFAVAVGVTLNLHRISGQTAGGIDTINQLDQWKSDGTNITQNVASKPVRITGLESKNCIGTDSNGVLQTGTCGSGSGNGLSTTSPWTARNLAQVVDNGHVTSIATSALNLTLSSFASPNISQWTNDASYITAAAAPVQSVSNSDSSLTISPTTGAVVASLNLANPNTWTGLQTFGNASSTLFSSSYASSTQGLFGSLTVAGVTGTGVTGTGNWVMSAAPTFTGTAVFAGITAATFVRAGTAVGSVLTLEGTNNAAPTKGTAAIKFLTGASVLTESARVDVATSNWGFGTTTPYGFQVTIASSTGAQLSLADGSATANPWDFRSINGNLYIATSSPSTFATSTSAALTIDTNGNIIANCFKNPGGSCITGSGGGITALGPTGQTQSGPTITLATSSTAFNGLTASTTITGSGNTLTFTNTLAGTLGVAGGGTGQGTFTVSQLLYGNGTNALSSVATSSVSNGTGISISGGGAVVGSGGLTITNTSPLSGLSVAFPLSFSNPTLSWIGLATTSQPTAGQLLYSNGTTGLTPVATTSFAAANATLTVTGTLGALVGGANSTIALNLGNANTWTALQTFGNASSTAFSTSYASSTNEFVGTLNLPNISGSTQCLHVSSTGVVSGTGSDCGSGGGGSPGGTGTELQYRSGASTFGAVTGSAFNTLGLLGLGSTTPWGVFSVASSTLSDFTRPLFIVSTTSDAFGQLLSAFATTTTQNPIAAIAGDLSSMFDTGVRIAIGGFERYRGLLLDQLNINGRINTGDWTLAECKGGSEFAGGTVISDASRGCGDLAYQIDSASNLRFTDDPQSPAIPIQIQLTGTTVNGGGSLVAGGNGLWASGATSTPIMEAVVSAAPLGTATWGVGSTTAYVGMINIDTSGTTFEVAPTAGCYFTASTTAANWQAVCQTSSVNITQIDTGLSTTSPNFYRFRVEMDNNEARFYTQSTSTRLTLLAKVSGANYPATTKLSPAVLLARGGTSGQIANLFIEDIRVWFRRTLWAN